MGAGEKEFDRQVIATTLVDVVRETFKKMGNVNFSKEPTFLEKPVLEYDGRMRVLGLEKFNGPCYVAAINFYLSEKKKEAEDAHGALVLYVEHGYAESFLKTLGYAGFDDEDEETILNNCGEFCNVIAGHFCNRLSEIGYRGIVMSVPVRAVNDIPEGVPFKYSEHKYYELEFHIWKEKILVLAVTMAPAAHS